jgi:dTDP-4-amino-4,6-dideoxygalactose transaminase
MSNKENIYVAKAFLPPFEEYSNYLKEIWESHQLTNGGPLVNKLEQELKEYLNLDTSSSLIYVTNGTLALQLAIRALEVEGEVITTPFTYVATVSSILWERCVPVFVDVDPETLCIDPNKIEDAITPKTTAIMPVHVFGNPCDIDKIRTIAKRNNLKVIYDGAHAFGVETQGKSLLDSGDISICSFHATKLFHTIEGGCLVIKDRALANKVEIMRRFGHNDDEHLMLGINAKASEFQAAMGLCNLKYIDGLIAQRKKIAEKYDKITKSLFKLPKWQKKTKYNYAYYPIITKDKEETLKLIRRFNENQIYPRRYFYPSLNKLPYLPIPKIQCKISEDISQRILCLPLYNGLEPNEIERIGNILNKGHIDDAW